MCRIVDYFGRSHCAWIAVAASFLLAMAPAIAAETAESSGVRAYFGMVPAAILNPKDLQHGPDFNAWGRVGPLPDAHHLLIALFDAATGKRIVDATVEVRDLAPAGGATPWKADRLRIADAIVYGRLIRLSMRRVHEFEIRVQRPDAPVVTFHYSYDARH